MRDVTAKLLLPHANHAEIFQTLSSELGFATFSSEVRIDIPNPEDPVLSLHYTKAGAITKIETVLSDADILNLRSVLENKLLKSDGTRYAQHIMFSHNPVVGKWSHERFTIVEAPATAPRPPYAVGKHPFIIEFPIEASPDRLTTMMRSQRVMHELELLLCAITYGIMPRERYTEQRWVMLMDKTPPADKLPDTLWAQDSYSIEDFNPLRDTPYADGIDADIELVDNEQYYGDPSISVSDNLKIPALLGTALDKYFASTEQVRAKFLRSAYWLRHAEVAHKSSSSASLMASIQAIEALLPKTSGEKCPTCGLTVGPGPTQKFQAFMDKYAPAPDEVSKKLQKKLYNQRSQMTHGHSLFTTDIEINFGWSSPLNAHESSMIRYATKASRVATINWLLSGGGDPQS